MKYDKYIIDKSLFDNTIASSIVNKIYYTGVYSEKTYNILERTQDILLQLYNGLNSNISFKNSLYLNVSFAKPKIMSNNEVVWFASLSNLDNDIYKHADVYTAFRATIYHENKNSQDIRSWLAGMIYNVACDVLRHEFIDNNLKRIKYPGVISPSPIACAIKDLEYPCIIPGNKNINIECEQYIKEAWGDYKSNKRLYLFHNDININDVSCLYYILMNDIEMLKMYPKEVLDRIIGVERDPVAVEAKKLWLEKIVELNDLHKYNLKMIKTEYEKRLSTSHLERTESELFFAQAEALFNLSNYFMSPNYIVSTNERLSRDIAKTMSTDNLNSYYDAMYDKFIDYENKRHFAECERIDKEFSINDVY